MATIKDIARLAGVSYGTVSNVLNRRGNVSAQKIKLVEEAADKLGYRRNNQASFLKRKDQDAATILLPARDLGPYQELAQGLMANFDKHSYPYELHYYASQQQLANYLSSSLSECSSCVILFEADLDLIPLDRLQANRIFLINCRGLHPVGDKYTRVSLDQFAIYEAFSREYDLNKVKKIAVICKDLECDLYLFQLLAMQGIELDFYQADNYYMLFQLVNQIEPEDLVLSLDYQQIIEIKKIALFLNKDLSNQIFSLSSSKILESNQFYTYQIDYYYHGQRLSRFIRHQLPLMDYALEGHKHISPQLKTSKGKLRIISAESTTFQAIEQLKGNFTKKTGIELEIDILDFRELVALVFNQDPRLAYYDLIRLDVAWLRDIGAELFQEIDSQLVETISQKLMASSYEYSLVNGKYYAFPLDASVQMLFYRKDLFNDQWLQRLYYEEHGQVLRVPQNFDEFTQVSNFFTKELNPTSPVDYGHHFVTTGAELLPRIYSLVYQDQTVKGDQAELLVEEISQSITDDLSIHRNTSNQYTEICNHFANGKTAMEILFFNRASQITVQNNHFDRANLGSAPIPGQQPALGGGCLGIHKESNNAEAVYQFINWLYSDEISNLVVALGGFIPNQSIASNSSLLEANPWLKRVEESFKNGRRYNHSLTPDANYRTEQGLLKQIMEAAGIEAAWTSYWESAP